MYPHLAILVALTGLVAGCGDPAPRSEAAAVTTPTPPPEQTPRPERSNNGNGADSTELDPLTIELVTRRSSVPAGGVLRTDLVVANNSGEPVTDPACWLASGRFGLLPADTPDAELWGAIVVDCAGPETMAPGYRKRISGPDFYASDPGGEPLPPGDYLAALQLEGRSDRLFAPVEVIAS